jgi:hypothetical protein
MTWLGIAGWRLLALLPALWLASAAAAHPIGNLDHGASAAVAGERFDPPGEAAIALVDQPMTHGSPVFEPLPGSPAHEGIGSLAYPLAEGPGEFLVHRDDPAATPIDPTAAPAPCSGW